MNKNSALTEEEKSLLGQISHISATPEFIKNPENLKLLAKMVKGVNAKPENPKLFDTEDKGATFSNDRKFRYSLWRIWDNSKPLVMFIGLNPSSADENKQDRTIESVIRISMFNGYGGFYMMNCWAYIATKPEDLLHDPLTDEWNNNMLTVIASKCQDIVYAWGNFKIIRLTGRDKEIKQMFPTNAKVIGLNKNGSPKHPLFQKEKTILIPFLSINGGDAV